MQASIALGNQLISIHRWLREELAGLREDLDLDPDVDASAKRPRDLRAHCLTFCSALSRHHTDEDGGTFPVLAEQFPALRPVIEELRRDHRMVAGILGRLQELLGSVGAPADPAEAARVRAEVDGLAAVLESHFVYEEKKLVAALNSLNATSGH